MEQDLPDQPAELAKEDLPDQCVEPLADRAQDLVSSGKEVWAATVSERTVLFEYVRNASWGVKQPDIVAKLINLQDADTVAAWSQDRALPRILVREEEGEIWVSSEFLQTRCKKLSLEMSPRSQCERSRSPRRSRPLGRGLQVRPLPAKAEDAKPAEDVEMADAQPADDKPAEDVAMADAKPAEAEAAELQHMPAQESAEQADDKPAEEAEDDKPAELQDMPAQEPAEQAEDDKPAEEAEDDMPAQEPDAVMEPAPAEPSDSSQGAGPVQGLRTTDKGNGWHELMARTLEEYTADLEIIKRRLNDGTIDKVSLRWSVDPGDLPHQQPAEAGPEDREALGAATDALVQVHVA